MKFKPHHKLPLPSTRQAPQWPTLIRQYRKRYHLSKTAFGNLFGVSHQAVGYWESGRSNPPAEVTWLMYKEQLKRLKERHHA